MSEFDIKAKTWDANPVNWGRAEAIAHKIRERIKLSSDRTALEFGAGTGILSFLLKDSLKEITLMDNSKEMVKVMEEKIEKEQVAHLKPLFFDLETHEYKFQTFDIVLSQMVLHHVSNVKAMIAKFYTLLNPGGSLAIADLYAEEGWFHGHGFTGHKGFDGEALSQVLADAGFKNIVHETCYVMEKQTEANGTMKFPLFIMTATK